MTAFPARKVLLVKMSSLGDVVHALPAVSDAALHGVQVDWVVEEAFADIPAAHPGVDRVLPISWRRWRRGLRAAGSEMREFWHALRAQPYDLVIDSQGLIKSAAVSLMARGRCCGFSFTTAREPWAAFAYAAGFSIDRAQHAIDRQRQLFAAALDYELEPLEVSGLEQDAPRSRQVVLLHGTTWPTKHWPVRMWQDLARRIRADGYEPVVTWGTKAERARAQQIADDSGAELIERMPLAELGALLGGAAAVIGVDSGLSHYSAALGTPTLGLYGPTSGRLTACRGVAADYLQAQIPCSPCLSKRCRYRGAPLSWQQQPVDPPCFASLPPERVWARARELMAQHQGQALRVT